MSARLATRIRRQGGEGEGLDACKHNLSSAERLHKACVSACVGALGLALRQLGDIQT